MFLIKGPAIIQEVYDKVSQHGCLFIKEVLTYIISSQEVHHMKCTHQIIDMSSCPRKNTSRRLTLRLTRCCLFKLHRNRNEHSRMYLKSFTDTSRCYSRSTPWQGSTGSIAEGRKVLDSFERFELFSQTTCRKFCHNCGCLSPRSLMRCMLHTQWSMVSPRTLAFEYCIQLTQQASNIHHCYL